MICGGLISLIHGFLCITLKSDQVVSGIMIVLLGLGLTSFIGEVKGMVGKKGYGFEPIFPARYKLTTESLENLKKEGLPDDILKTLKLLGDQKFKEEQFVKALEEQIGPQQTVKYKEPILKQTRLRNLGDLPFLGPILFQHNVLVYLAVVLVPVTWIFLFKTRIGLEIIAVGEDPSTADTLGISVEGVRYICVFVGGVFAGLGGCFLSLAYTQIWIEQMTAGRGWIAIALVIFSAWTPQQALIGAYLFGGIEGLQLRLQAAGIGISHHLLQMMPYAATILVLLFSAREKFRRRMGAPEALLKPYVRGERD
jgi:ABC-type uncharacterized transport system permease subunit